MFSDWEELESERGAWKYNSAYCTCFYVFLKRLQDVLTRMVLCHLASRSMSGFGNQDCKIFFIWGEFESEKITVIFHML